MNKTLLLMYVLCTLFFAFFSQQAVAISLPQPSEKSWQKQGKSQITKAKTKEIGLTQKPQFNKFLLNKWFFIMCGFLGLSLIFYVLGFSVFALTALIGAGFCLLLWLIMWYLGTLVFC